MVLKNYLINISYTKPIQLIIDSSL